MTTVNVRDAYGPDRAHVALACASFGWPVFPIIFSGGVKRPCIKNWPNEATTDPEVIHRWWVERWVGHSFPGADVGIVTGRRSGLWVLDVDAKNGVNGYRTLLDLLAAHDVRDRPNTFIVGTPSGGEHWYLAYPTDGREVQNSASGRLGPGLDTRGRGGYVVAPGQSRLNVDAGRVGRYEPLVDGVPLATAWRWLEDLVERRRPTRPANRSVVTSSANALRLLEREADRLAATPPSGRNHALNRAAFVLGCNGIDRHTALSALLAACGTNGLLDDPRDGEAACLVTFESGWNAGTEELEASA